MARTTSRKDRFEDSRATARAEALAWVTTAWRSEQMLRALESDSDATSR